MDASYKLRNFFIKTAKNLNNLKAKKQQELQIKLQIINEIEEDLFYMRESAKKMFREQKIKESVYTKLKEKIKNIEKEIKIIKSDLTNPWP